MASYAPVLVAADAQASQKTELVHGQGFNVYASQGTWLFGQAQPLLDESTRAGYVGWVDGRHLVLITDDMAALTHRVSSVSAPVFIKPDLKTHISQNLPLGSRLSVRAEVGEYRQIGASAWVHQNHLRRVDDFETNLVDVAQRYLSQPYVWGGIGARGLDCSALIQMSLDACGIDAPRDSDMQEQALGEAVSLTEKSGDLLFWKGHVGLISRPGYLLHANATHMLVVDEPLEPALKRIAASGTPLRSVKRLKT